MQNIPDNVLEAVREAAVDNRLSCTMAHKLADELKVPPRIIGRAADQLKIRIHTCQLGCF